MLTAEIESMNNQKVNIENTLNNDKANYLANNSKLMDSVVDFVSGLLAPNSILTSLTAGLIMFVLAFEFYNLEATMG